MWRPAIQLRDVSCDALTRYGLLQVLKDGGWSWARLHGRVDKRPVLLCEGGEEVFRSGASVVSRLSLQVLLCLSHLSAFRVSHNKHGRREDCYNNLLEQVDANKMSGFAKGRRTQGHKRCWCPKTRLRARPASGLKARDWFCCLQRVRVATTEQRLISAAWSAADDGDGDGAGGLGFGGAQDLRADLIAEDERSQVSRHRRSRKGNRQWQTNVRQGAGRQRYGALGGVPSVPTSSVPKLAAEKRLPSSIQVAPRRTMLLCDRPSRG